MAPVQNFANQSQGGMTGFESALVPHAVLGCDKPGYLGAYSTGSYGSYKDNWTRCQNGAGTLETAILRLLIAGRQSKMHFQQLGCVGQGPQPRRHPSAARVLYS
jgi:hypothetical protein